MLVKSIRDHSNAYGDSYEKPAGKVYDHPEPGQLIADKLVEVAKAEKPKE